MALLTRIRPSNLIILFALPFIVWLFATSPDYGRSLKAIVGVERGSSAFLPGFLLALLASGGALLAVNWKSRIKGMVAGALALAAGAAIFLTDAAHPFAASVLANAVDPFTSALVVQGETPRRLTEDADTMLGAALPPVVMGWLVVTLAGLILSRTAGRIGRVAVVALAGLNGAIFAYLVLAAYLGFAAGVATSIRAAVLAYVLAVILALVWVGMMQLRLSRHTGAIFAGLIAFCALAAAWQFTQPKASYVLVGSQSGTIGVVKDTPEGLISAMKYGTFPGAAADGFKLKSFSSGADAMADLETGSGITAALVPQPGELPTKPVLWQIEALADGNRMAGTAFAVVGILLGLLLAGGLAHHRHPLSVGAEFVVDTIRGIPMLVIVLYIGLPLAGAVKDASGGFIDPPNLLRGIIAMALAYSAYLAEIFRAGINAVPIGQIEAARSLGLTRWQTARNVILPQAFRIIIPPLGNEFIAILKDTSLLSILSIRDITQRMREFQSASFLPFAPYNSAAIFYVLLTLVAASLVASIERKYHIARR